MEDIVVPRAAALHGSKEPKGRGAVWQADGEDPPEKKNANAKVGGSLELARLAGIEPTTLGFGGQYSIH